MTGRESRQPHQTADGTMEASASFQRTDLPAPQVPAVPATGTAGITLSPALLAWLRDHDIHRRLIDAARTDREHGRRLPDGFPRLLRDIIDAETANPIAGFRQAESTNTKLDPSDRQSLSAVAERFGLAKRTLRHWCETGQVHAEQPGQHGHWKVSATSVAAHLQKRNP